jgi:hypothetical protein
MVTQPFLLTTPMSSFSLEQLAAIAALPDDQRTALAQENSFAAVPTYLGCVSLFLSVTSF